MPDSLNPLVSAATGARPRPVVAWAVSLVTIVGWAMIRIGFGSHYESFIPLTYVVPLLLCVWTRSRLLLRVMAVTFALVVTVEVWVVYDATQLPGHSPWPAYLSSLVNIAIGVFVVGVLLSLRDRLDSSLGALAARTERLVEQGLELTQQNEQLASQAEEITQQAEELSAQAEELAEQNEELHVQFEEIQGLNQSLTRQEQLLQTLLDTVQRSESEDAALRHIADATLEILGDPASAVAVFRATDEGLVLHARSGTEGPVARPADDAFVRLTLAEGRTGSLPDTSVRPDLTLLELTGGTRPQSVLCAPAVSSGGASAALAVYARAPHAWTQDQFHLATWLANQAVQVLLTLRLQDAVRRQAAIVDLSPDPIVVWAPDGRVLSWNPAASELYRIPAETALGADLHQLLRTRFPVSLESARAALERVGRWSGELVHETSDGRLLLVHSRWQARRDAQGTLVEVIECNVDLTDRKRVEDELRHASERKSEFLATLSHELRNPLAPMRYAIELLSRAGAEPETREPVQVLDRQLTHLVRLVDDLLDATRIASNKIQLRPTPLDLNDLIRQAVRAVFPGAAGGPQHDCLVVLP